MRRSLLTVLGICFFHSIYCQSFDWAKGSNIYSYGKQTYVDSYANIYVRGNNVNYSTTEEIRFFVAKYDSLGNFQWVIDNLNDTRAGLRSKFLYITSKDSSLYYLSRYDTNGTLIWKKNTNSGQISTVQIDTDGNAIIAGLFTGTISFGTYSLSNPGMACGADYFIAKYDSSGTCLWAGQSNGCAMVRYPSISIDNSNNIIIHSAIIGNVSIVDTSIVSTSENGIIAKYSTEGNFKWAHKITGGENWIQGLATDATGNIYGAGYLGASVTIAGNTFSTSGTWQNIYLFKFSESGQELWSKQISGPWKEYAEAVEVNNKNEMFVTGSFGDPVNFGTVTLSNAGFMEPFVAKYDSLGNNLWAVQFGGAGSGYGMALQNNKIVVTGSMGGTVDFGGHPITNPPNALFLTKLTDDFSVSAAVENPVTVDDDLLAIYPNPGIGCFVLRYIDPTPSIAKLEIHNAEGQLIFSSFEKCTNGEFLKNIDLSKEPKGIYFLQVIADGKKRSVKKIVLN